MKFCGTDAISLAVVCVGLGWVELGCVRACLAPFCCDRPTLACPCILSTNQNPRQIGVELQLPSTHEWSGTYWYWDYVMTTKMMTEGSLREAKEQLEEVKAQIEVHKHIR